MFIKIRLDDIWMLLESLGLDCIGDRYRRHRRAVGQGSAWVRIRRVTVAWARTVLRGLPRAGEWKETLEKRDCCIKNDSRVFKNKG